MPQRFLLSLYFLSFLGVQFLLAGGSRLLSLPEPGVPFGFLNGLALAFAMAFMILTVVADLTRLHGSQQQPYSPLPCKRLVHLGIYGRNRAPRFWLGFFEFLAFCFVWPGGRPPVLTMGILGLGAAILIQVVGDRLRRKRYGNDFHQLQRRVPFWGYRWKLNEYDQYPLIQLLAWFLALVWFRTIYHLQVTGQEHIPRKAPFVVIAPHESYLDPFFFGVYLPYRVFYVTTADVFTSGGMRFLLKAVGTFPIQRHKQDLKAIRTMLRLLANGQVVGIFPEGGRTMDGLPQEIVPETVKLLQRTGVDLLPVRIEGAGEVWPRWAPNRRRGRIQVSFQPVIPFAPKRSLEELHGRISQAIFIRPHTPQPVTSEHLTDGIQTVLWGCPHCWQSLGIRILDNRRIHCTICSKIWEMEDDYRFRSGDELLTIPQWLGRLRARIQPEANGVILASDAVFYLNGENQEQGTLELDAKGFSFITNSEKRRWDLGKITVFTLDSRNSFSLGMAGRRHTFRLGNGDIPLRWEDHYRYILGNTEKESIR